VNELVAEMEAAGKPIVAAIAAHALGGGLELALWAQHRIATVSARLGLPEVSLGLLPGGGGTQRLPRLIGPEKALEMMLGGKPIAAEAALAIGLVDVVVQGDLLQAAVEFARKASASPVERRPNRLEDFDRQGLDRLRETNRRKWRGLLAPGLIVDCIEKALTVPIQEGLAFEAQAFQRCLQSPQRAALVHLFNAERTAAKVPGLENVEPREIRSAAVIGSGTMGSGIAMTFANAGIPVVLLDTSRESLERGLGMIRRNYENSLKRGSTDAAQVDRALSLISTTLDNGAVADCDIAVEAAFEDMALKKKIFERLDATMKPGAILATNTSTLDIDQIAGATGRPEAVVGTHFFSPAHVMKLQENVRTARTAPEVVATVMALARKLGKVPVLAANRDGFIGNRILAAYGRECDFLLEEGATPWQVDRALQEFGFPMGLYLMRDMAGLDVSWRVRQYREALRDKSLRYSTIADRLCELGRFGQKTGKGYYRYEGEGPGARPAPDPETESLIGSISEQCGIARRSVSDEEIVTRVLTAMVNEGARILADGVALRASDIDITYVHGYGFPRHEGGPMYWAERKGLAWVLEQVRHQHGLQGKLWEPSGVLEAAAVRGQWAA
jgi:3-hydroxyacyl-CoA dehydrogenase